MELKQELIKYGLKGKKLDFYLVLLREKQGTVRDLAGKTNIKRTTAYNLIKQLTATGLAKIAKDGKKSIVLAECPDKIRQNLDQKLGLLDKILPELNKIYKTKTENGSFIKSLDYQQFEQFFSNLNKDPNQSFYLFLNNQDSWPIIRKTFSNKLGLSQKLLIITNSSINEADTLGQTGQIKLQKKGESGNLENLIITNNSVILFPHRQISGCLIIENYELATIIKAAFLALWELLPAS
jgi:predicted transcriptional regulator